jgi:hypothetical protein
VKLSQWPGFRVVVILMSWVLLAFVVVAWRSYWALSQVADANGVAAVSFPLAGPVLLAFGPPLALLVAWALLRRRSSGSQS